MMAELTKSAAELLDAMRRGEKVNLIPHPTGEKTPYFVRANFVDCTEAAIALVELNLARIEGLDSWSKSLVLVDQTLAAKQRAAESQVERVSRMNAEAPAMYDALCWLIDAIDKKPTAWAFEPDDKTHLQSIRTILARIDGAPR